jgi:AraC family carnitine catabolism transcriptional activator
MDHLGFVLLPEFPIYALIPALEALRVANQSAGRRLYTWQILSLDGAPVRAGSGMTMSPDAGIDGVTTPPSMVIVCAGNRPTQHITRPLLLWLQRVARCGAALGAIDTGVFTLAAAGLLDGYRVTLHWEAIPVFREQYPDIEVLEQLLVVDRNRLTCAGGMAAFDMMLDLIARRHGYALAQVVANGFVHEGPRRDDERQRRVPTETGAADRASMLGVIRTMEAHLDTPLSPPQLAARNGLSVRQLERLVRRRLNDSPMRYYLKVRLQAARHLLFYSDRTVQEIALACGFSSPEIFSRCFRAQFGRSPRDFRREFTGDRLQRFRPEIGQRLSPVEPPIE